MKHLTLLLLLLCISLPSSVYAEPPSDDSPRLSTINDVDSELREFIKKQFPKASFSVTDDTFVVKADTMIYTVHNVFRGVVSKKTHREEGPLSKGFILRIERTPGKYGGPAFVPSTHREPYWSTTLNDIVDDEMKTHLWVVYKWGPGIDANFHRGLRKRLRCEGRTFPDDFGIVDTAKKHDEPSDAPKDRASRFDIGRSTAGPR